ncbi:hypothetical protein DPMN_180189 [Dreissena polymorpha]|uniref:Uncharacterized protein n=1 Tax=Dreissena polymorpha TaxID=45954 RepID=A0A9D4EDS4_DREPO|nr:hypothetical protein DPMN_180189 [Dreissena polymorpha]
MLVQRNIFDQGQMDEDAVDAESKSKPLDDKDHMRLSLGDMDQEEYDEDPLKTNRVLAALLQSERAKEATPIGVEEVRCGVGAGGVSFNERSLGKRVLMHLGWVKTHLVKSYLYKYLNLSEEC